jgi:hypothetical protein
MVSAERGGSNYVFFALNGCRRSDWVTSSYLAHKAAIDGQLAALYRSGQRRLRLSVPMSQSLTGAGPRSGVPEGYAGEVSAFLNQVRETGFQEIVVVAGDPNPPAYKWRIWNESLYQRHWAQIAALHTLLRESGLHYLIDLGNEAIPAVNQPLLLQFSRRLWNDYRKAYGISDTLGFSMIANIAQDRFSQIPLVYGDTYPQAFDIHIYDDPGRTFLNAHKRLSQLGLGRIPWIIGEVYYNDQVEAAELVSAIRQTRQPVLFLLQWPLTSARLCRDVDIAAPLEFDAYEDAGF